MVTVSQIMTNSIVQLDVGTSAIEAAKLMTTCKVGSIFVRRDNKIIGIVTEPDIVRKVVGRDRLPYYIPVEDIMSSPVVGIEEDRPITEAAEVMEQHGTRHLAVFKSGQVVGVISVRDLLHPVSIDEF
jgi:CBS domain-containing protein